MRAHLAREGEAGAAYAAVACGANINFDRLRHVAERAAIGENTEAILAVKIPERPGAFRQLCDALGARSITEFNYRMGDPQTATVFVGVQTSHAREGAELASALDSQGFQALDLTDNELAKTHVRHMVGGRCPNAQGERLYHVDFPERKGALMTFLNHMGRKWNISLFHYRNHGSDRGRVLVGFEVPEGTEDEFTQTLASLKYDVTDESENPALRLFL
jgi:threonine dehydratase